jgi:hypothetical protein
LQEARSKIMVRYESVLIYRIFPHISIKTNFGKFIKFRILFQVMKNILNESGIGGTDLE